MNVLKGIVKMVMFDNQLEEEVLVVESEGKKVIIPRSELDKNRNWKSLITFVGHPIEFVVLETKEDYLLGSRKAAQIIAEETLLPELQDGLVIEAEVINLFEYAAYISFGSLTGVLKNTDFSEDYTTCKDVLKLGDKIKVRLKRISDSGTLSFEAIEKYANPSVVEDFSVFEPGQLFYGVVRNLTTTGCYVNIMPGVDGLAPIPNGEIQPGSRVAFRVNKVFQEERRVRGRVIKILG